VLAAAGTSEVVFVSQVDKKPVTIKVVLDNCGFCYYRFFMNYPPTRRLTVQRDILPRIGRELPDTKDVRELFAGITEAMLKTAKITNAKNRKGKET